MFPAGRTDAGDPLYRRTSDGYRAGRGGWPRRHFDRFHRRDMKRGTLLGIIKDAGLTTDEFIKLLRG